MFIYQPFEFPVTEGDFKTPMTPLICIWFTGYVYSTCLLYAWESVNAVHAYVSDLIAVFKSDVLPKPSMKKFDSPNNHMTVSVKSNQDFLKTCSQLSENGMCIYC